MNRQRFHGLTTHNDTQPLPSPGAIRRCVRFIKSKFRPPAARNKDDLIKLVRRATATAQGVNGKDIFILTTRGWANHVALESILGARLRMDGHHVTFLLCEDSIPFCMYGSVNSPPEKRRNCAACIQSRFSVIGGSFPSLSIPPFRELEQVFLSQVEGLDLPECISFEYEGAPYGQLVKPSVIWYLRRSRLTRNDASTYQEAIVSAHAVRRFLEKLIATRQVDALVGLNGDFLVGKVADWVMRRHGIRWVTYDYAFNEYVLVGLNASCWDDLTFDSRSRSPAADLTEDERLKAERLLSRWRKQGGYQGDLYWSRPQTEFRDRSQESDNQPCAVAFTNLTFESSVIGKERIFAGQFEWLEALIRFFDEHSDYRLIVRVHPAEVRDSHWRPRESLYAFLTGKRRLPSNVSIVAPQDETSSYAIAESASVILVYSSNIGMEMVDRGKMVITAAHSHYAGRGFTMDPETEATYFDIISEAMHQIQASATAKYRDRLVNYVAWLFSRRLIRFEPLASIGETWPKVNLKTPEALASLDNGGLNKLCGLVERGEMWW